MVNSFGSDEYRVIHFITECHASSTSGVGGPLNGLLYHREPLKRVSTNGVPATASFTGAVIS